MKKPRKKISQAAVATSKYEETSKSMAAHVIKVNDTSKSKLNRNNTWIINTGASDHMKNDSSKLTSLCSPPQSNIVMANGGEARVICEGFAHISSSINLDTVLVVPSLSSNLLFISRFTKTMNYFETFWPDECVFQKILTRRILGYGVRRGKLY